MRSRHLMLLLVWEVKTRKTCFQGRKYVLCSVRRSVGCTLLSDVSIPNQNHTESQNGFVGNYITFSNFL